MKLYKCTLLLSLDGMYMYMYIVHKTLKSSKYCVCNNGCRYSVPFPTQTVASSEVCSEQGCLYALPQDPPDPSTDPGDIR